MKVDVILGLQWGDEGKGKIVDYLAKDYDIIARFQGGANAGHTLWIDGKKIVLHLIPSGIIREKTINVLGPGMVIDPVELKKEIEYLEQQGIKNVKERVVISDKAILIHPIHKMVDVIREEGEKKIGSTKKGIGPSYSDKYSRRALIVRDIFQNFQEKIENLISIYKKNGEFNLLEKESFENFNSEWLSAIEYLSQLKVYNIEEYINKELDRGSRVLAEGAQGTLLDVNFGSYPYVTSSHTTTGGVCIGLGVAPNRIGRVYGVFKAYCTRVGEGPFPTYIEGAMQETLREKGFEYGATTGRPRKCGWLDIPALRYSIMVNGVTNLVMMKSDVLSGLEEISVCTEYVGQNNYNFSIDENVKTSLITLNGWKEVSGEDSEFIRFKSFIQSCLNKSIDIVSYGPEREQIKFF